MRPFAPQLSRTSYNPTLTQARAVPAASYTFNPASFTFSQREPSKMASTDAGELKIENTNIKTAPGVDLSESQKTLIGSVLDLFAGRPSLAKLQLWKDDADFVDPICIAKGRKQYEAQWYGLQTAFSEIERLHHEVTSAGNPIEMDMKTRYVVKGLGKEQIMQSKVLIHTEGDKISKVEDKWNGTLPDSGIANVSSVFQMVNPLWWVKYAEGWAFWMWSFVWETTPWRVRDACSRSFPFADLCFSTLADLFLLQAFRRLNANVMPSIVGVPKSPEEDAKKGN